MKRIAPTVLVIAALALAVLPACKTMSSEELKASIVLRARQTGAPIAEAWEPVEKALEIDRSLAAFAAAGVRATYHTCDVSDRAALDEVLGAAPTIQRRVPELWDGHAATRIVSVLEKVYAG